MLTAKCIKESNENSWADHKHNLKVGEEYEVDCISMGQSHTTIKLKNDSSHYNSVIFKFYENGKELDIYSDKRFNPYL